MKKLKSLLVVFTLALITVALNAQTEAGKIYVGGSSDFSFSASTEKYKSDDMDGTLGKSVDLSLAPEAGFFVIDGLAVGLSFDLSLSTFKLDDSDSKSTFTSFLAAPFVKYYYNAGNIKPFAMAHVGLGSYSFKNQDNDTDKTGIFGYGIGIGAAMFVSENAAIEFGIGYESVSTKDKEDNDENFRDITSGIGVNIGVIVVL